MAELKMESQVYKLYELRTRIGNDKEKYEQMEKDYTTLVEIVSESEKAKTLPEDFVTGIKDNLGQIKGEIKKMEDRLGYLQILIDKYENEDGAVDEITTLLFAALGIAIPTDNE